MEPYEITVRANRSFSFEAGEAIVHGIMIAPNAEGKAVPATSDGKQVFGVYSGREDIEAGGLLAVDTNICVTMDNSVSDPLTNAERGELCYVEDERTVSKTGTAVAGRCMEVMDDLVWVKIGA